jgi:hypothetical protein
MRDCCRRLAVIFNRLALVAGRFVGLANHALDERHELDVYAGAVCLSAEQPTPQTLFPFAPPDGCLREYGFRRCYESGGCEAGDEENLCAIEFICVLLRGPKDAISGSGAKRPRGPPAGATRCPCLSAEKDPLR